MSAGKDSGLTFEQALGELEQITADIEDGSMPLEEVVAAYKRGAKLLDFCRKKLGAAKDAVAQLDDKTADNAAAIDNSAADGKTADNDD